MSDQVNLSFVADEVIASGQGLEVRTVSPVDLKAARDSIVLEKDGRTVPVPVSIDPKGVIVKISTKDVGTGNFNLHVHQLIDKNGKELVNHRITPFRIISLGGETPGKRIDHVTRVALGDMGVHRLEAFAPAPSQGRYLEFVKATDLNSKRPVELAFDETGSEVDGKKLLAEVNKARFAKFGKVHESLFNHLKGLKSTEKVNLAVWPRLSVDLTAYEKPNQAPIHEPPAEAKKLLQKALDERSKLIAKIKDVVTIRETPDHAPVVYVTVKDPAQAQKLAQEDAIGAIFLDDKTEEPDLSDSVAISRATQAQNLGFTGSGVRVAVWERGPDNTTNLSIAGRYSTNPATSTHSRLTHAIIKNIEQNKPHGYAPNCSLYSANSPANAALEWAVETPQSCTVISQSFHRTKASGQDEQGSPNLSTDDILKDQLAVTFPFPTIVHAAGNSDPENAVEYVNHKGYNTISVGSHDDAATQMAGSSIFLNPNSPRGDRELPEIAANGVGVSAVGLSMSGTSFAAPAVAGTVALIQSVNGILKSWPEGNRAILFATADRNISGGTWTQDLGSRIDQSDGAGALNAQLAVLVAQQRQNRNNNPVPRGWDVGTLSTADVDATTKLATFRYRIKVPEPPLLLPRTFYTVKAALAWDAKLLTDAQGVLSSRLTVDLDLIVRDANGVQVAASSSFDNSYEVVEFAGTRGAEYEILIRRFSGEEGVWFGVAWNVTSRTLLLPRIPGLDVDA